MTSRARRAIAILRGLCDACNLYCVPFMDRMLAGFREYGAENHLSPDFDTRREHDAEHIDCVDFYALGINNGTYDPADPNVAAGARASAESYTRSQLRPYQYPGRPLLVYIAGPYSAVTPESVAANVSRAEECAWAIMRKGHVPFCPHSMSHGWEAGGFAWEEFLRIDLEWLRRCDAICMVGAWQDSRGALLERRTAEDLHLWVCKSPADLPVFIGAEDMPEPE